MGEPTTVKRGTRLAVADWVNAGMQVLVDEGVDAIKVARLSNVLGVTKGSFYWHFTDIGALKTALAEHCREAQSVSADRIAALSTVLSPTERIEEIARLASDPRRWKVEAALRHWAEIDDAMKGSITSVDERIYQITHQAMLELGFVESEARARSTALLYAGIGYLHAKGRLGIVTDEDMATLVSVLTRR